MSPQPITEEQNVHPAWYEEARKQTVKTLPAFIKKLTEEYEHDYGTICHAIAAAAIGAAWAVEKSPQGGITGFQASCIMWVMIRHWNYRYNVCGLRMVDLDDLLYPQFADRFEKTISQDVMDKLQVEANKRLSERGGVPEVREHWQSISDGKPPHGFRIVND